MGSDLVKFIKVPSKYLTLFRTWNHDQIMTYMYACIDLYIFYHKVQQWFEVAQSVLSEYLTLFRTWNQDQIITYMYAWFEVEQSVLSEYLTLFRTCNHDWDYDLCIVKESCIFIILDAA